MRARNTVCFFILLLLFSGLVHCISASARNVTFNGVGITINMIFPEEHYPNRTITHDINITSNINNLKLRNFTLFVYAPINSVLQYITNETVTYPSIQENQSLTFPVSISLPDNVKGRLYCLMYVETEISLVIESSSYTFYTTYISSPTISEIQNVYNTLLQEYELLNATYTELNQTFTNLSEQHQTLLAQNEDLIQDHDALEKTYKTLLAQYNKLSDDYNSLDAKYTSRIAELSNLETSYYDLNATRYDLQASYDTLDNIYIALNETYSNLQTQFVNLQNSLNAKQSELDSDKIVMLIFVISVAVLIAFIVYLRRKKEDPYLVIRKETVSMKSDKEN